MLHNLYYIIQNIIENSGILFASGIEREEYVNHVNTSNHRIMLYWTNSNNFVL